MLAPYTALGHAASRPVWIALRVLVLGATLALIVALFSRNASALTITWSLLFPLLPALWVIAPGLWRNLCPMAFVNQLPRELGFSRAFKRPHALRIWSYGISIALLLGAIAGRLLLFNGSEIATGLLLLGALVAAFLGGFLFEGKGGWCGTLCPLAPVQKLYGQRPAILVRNEYCSPCVGCQTHCYDFNPGAALPSDLFDRDAWSAGHRRFFAGMYPGFIAGYFVFAQFGVWGLVGFPLLSLGLFETMRTFTRVSAYLLVVAFGLAAICTYYAYATGTIAHGLLTVFAIAVPPAFVTGAEAAVIAGAIAIFVASVRLEYAYVRAITEEHVTRVGGAEELRDRAADAAGATVAERSSGRSFHATPQQSLLEAIEGAELPIESGCRMGMCGADPILIVAGADHLAPAGAEERSTLARLGLAANVRLACSCRATGPVQIDIDQKTVRAAGIAAPAAAAAPTAAPSLRVVIIGNGSAGMSAAEHLRRGDAAASITVVANEAFAFYNRMGIGRAIYGRSGLQGLTLLDDAWYERERIDVYLNTHAARIVRDERTLELATGERLPYDKLVIATGATAVKPDVVGVGLPGSFVLRTAEDAADLRRYAQSNGARRAVVLGGGVLGIEAADALRRVGLVTIIVARGKRLMERSLDDTSAAIMQTFLEGLGIVVHVNAAAASIDGDVRVRAVTLTDASTIATDIVVSCIGVAPNADLARAAGLAVGRGITVDAQMRTSDPDIFAAGDVAEFERAPSGLWPVGKKQGEIAAAAILGNTTTYSDVRAFSHVKLTGIDVRYFGVIDEPLAGQLEFSDRSADGREWRKVRFVENRLAGAVVVGFADTTQKLAGALSSGADCSAQIAALRAGDWSFPN